MFDTLKIEGGRGSYDVMFVDGVIDALYDWAQHSRLFFVLDAGFDGYRPDLAERVRLSGHSVVMIEATEDAKSLSSVNSHLNNILDRGLRRGDVLVAVGGGVMQDIVGFMASIVFRGVPWVFIPTTLVAQADSCIGSKTSINLVNRKNAVGTYHNPEMILIDSDLLSTLAEDDLRSGLGEMLKVHAIRGTDEFDTLARHAAEIRNHGVATGRFIRASLEIKRVIIESDERDLGPRLVMNYGHSFGHAIEVASQFRIPHGIAVTMGMDVANHVSFRLGFGTKASFDRMHPVLFDNAAHHWKVALEPETFAAALDQDKKNTPTHQVLVLPNSEGLPTVMHIPLPNNVAEIALNHLIEVGNSCR